MAKSAVGKWLDRKYIAWQHELGESKTIAEFVKYLGISRASFDKWSNGERMPDPESVRLLAVKCKDYQIYDLVGLPKPSKDMQRLMELFPNLTEEQRRQILELAEQNAATNKEHKVGAV